MIKIKLATLITLLIVALTGSVLYLTDSTSPLSNDTIESDYERLNSTLHDKFVNAENSLSLQANSLASDKELIVELGDLHDKLMTVTPEELKKNAGSNWNKIVFDKLINWKAQRKTALQTTTANEGLKASSGSATTLSQEINWWGKVPDLVLAFATVPMKEKISNINIAEGTEGKQLAKSYSFDIPILNDVSEDSVARFGHFPWGNTMYLATVAPVIRDGNHIGNIVVGYELSKNMIQAFNKVMPQYVSLSLVYSTKGMDDTKSQTVVYSASDEADAILKKTAFQTLANATSDNGATQAYDKLLYNRVYSGNYDRYGVSVRRIPWSWDESQKTDLYVLSNNNAANLKLVAFKTKVTVAGCITLIVGLLLMLLLIGSYLKKLAFIKNSFASAMSKGEPIDSKALALLMEEKADALDQYVIHPLHSNEDDKELDWDVLMDLSDEANVKADAALAQEDKDKLKNAADIEEAKPIFEEYMRLRKENHITTPMDFDTFLRRLQRNAEAIKKQHHCDNVTFIVHVKDGNVLLKPKIVQK